MLGGSRSSAVTRSEAFWVTVVVVWLLAWLPLQTPVVMLVYQYGGLPAEAARGVLLVKDLVVAILLLVLAVRHIGHLRLRWFDWMAIAYVALVGIYSIVPWLFGSQLPLVAVAASARIFVLPVELYAVGRLAVVAGLNLRLIATVFVATSAVAALFTVVTYVLLPASFWITTMDVPRFVREVQGLPGARTLWDISVLGHYGVGEGGQFARAIGPFTHPVGTGHYFVVPLLLSVAATFDASVRGASWRRILAYLALVLLFTAAVITPISRGSWLAAGLGVVVIGVIYRRPLVTFVALAAVGAFLLIVPPFSLSISSALSMSDSSVIAHGDAIEEGIDTVTHNPLGLGVGQADQPGFAFGGDAAAGVGENMYLSLLVTVGPLGLAAFLAWLLGVSSALLAAFRENGHWLVVATLAALVGFAASAATASPLMRFTTSAHFWLLLGLVVATHQVDLPGRFLLWRRPVATRTSSG
jgi:hypothetical protein